MQSAFAVKPRARQEELGQFLTPAPLADFMASLFAPFPPKVRLLDAGAGAGALTAAVVSRCCTARLGILAIDVTLYEVDLEILDALSLTMMECAETCSGAGIHFTYSIHSGDFIEEMSLRLAGDLFGTPPPAFDAAIVNPPYRKITSDSNARLSLRSAGVETSNLYTGFIAIIHRLLVPGGQLVAITPRSFCNGPYFKSFREDFLGQLELHRLHVFESRKAAFREDSVLQENIVFHAVKGCSQPPGVFVSSSSGEEGDDIKGTVFPFTEIVHPHDAGKFIHIPSTHGHAAAKELMDTLSTNLAGLGVSVSTGRVVDFRLKEALRQSPEKGTVPLLYPSHFNGGTVHWPRLEARKPNAILDNAETRSWLVPSGVYLLTKRFTSKEERRRLVACVFDPELVKSEWIGFENHLNYFHENGQGLDRTLAWGLYVYLNSTVVDQYFRRFSGHTQVNATDLRTLPFPTRATLKIMGSSIHSLNLTQDEIDLIVIDHVHASK